MCKIVIEFQKYSKIFDFQTLTPSDFFCVLSSIKYTPPQVMLLLV